MQATRQLLYRDPLGAQTPARWGWDHQVGLKKRAPTSATRCLPTATVFPSVCLVKKRQRLRWGLGVCVCGGGDWSWQPWGGLSCFPCVLLFSFFFPPALMCSCYSLLPPPTSCQWERKRDQEKDREREWEGMVVVVVGVNITTQHLLPGEEKRCVQKRMGGGGIEIGG